VAAARLDLPPRRPAGNGSWGRVPDRRDDPGPGRSAAPDFAERFEAEVRPALEAAGASVVGWMITETAENTFPRLPVREGEPVLVWIGRFADAAAHADHLVRAERAGLGDGFGAFRSAA
jgi:hypothetical protein